MCNSYLKRNRRSLPQLRQPMPIVLALVVAVAAFVGCKNDDVAARDADRSTARMEQQSEPVENEWQEAGQEIEEGAESVGEATATTVDEAGEEIKEGAVMAKKELDELGDTADEEFSDLRQDVDEEFHDEDEPGDAFEGEDDLAQIGDDMVDDDAEDFREDATETIAEIKAETAEIRRELDLLGEGADDSFQREFSELEERTMELEREVEGLEPLDRQSGQRALNDEERSLENDLRRLETDLERFEDKIDVAEEESAEMTRR